MTPDQLITRLKIPQDKLDRIKALSQSLHDFEGVLHEHAAQGKSHGPDTPVRKAIHTEATQCIELIAKILGESPEAAEATVLTLFGITHDQFDRSCTISGQIVALSALVAAQKH
jgi:hypothetical protein